MEVGDDMSDQWGPGNRVNDKAFETTKVGETLVELFFGEHPHARSDNNIYARFPSGTVEGFDGHRLLHEIKFRDYNYLKESHLSGNQVRKGGTCEIIINGNVCDSFFYREIGQAMIDAGRRLDKIHDFHIRLWDNEQVKKLVGRPIYYHLTPAIIADYFADQACVMIEAIEGYSFPKRPWRDDGDDDDYEERRVKDDIYSPHIWWWRE